MYVIMGKCAFITVGTTRFDLLIATLFGDEPSALRTLCDCLDVERVIVQTGLSPMPTPLPSWIAIEHYPYKDSIEDDIRRADLVISHAGAGTILQTLEAHKPLLVVVNEHLMNNHQLEIAHQMEQEGYLFHCTCATLTSALRQFVNHTFKHYEKGNPALFGRYLNQLMA